MSFSTLKHLAEALRMPPDLVNFLLKQLSNLLKRTTFSSANLLNTLYCIGSDDGLLRNAAMVILDRLKTLNVPIATVNAKLEDLKSTCPDFVKYVGDLYSDGVPSVSILSKIGTNGGVNGGLGGGNPNHKSFLASLKSLSIFPSFSLSSSTSSSSSQSSPASPNLSVAAKKRSSVILPYLIERCSALFWTRVVTREMKSFVPMLSSCEAALEPLSATDVLQQKPALFKPNFSLVLDAQEIEVHDWILYARWPWFRSLVNSGMAETLSKRVELPLNTFTYPGLVAFVYYLYSHQTDLYTPQLSAELLTNAEQFQLAELFSHPLKPHPAFDRLFQHSNSTLIYDLRPSNCVEKLKIAKDHGIKHAASAVLRYIATNILQITNNTDTYAKLMELDAVTIKEIFSQIQWGEMEPVGTLGNILN